MPGSLPFRVRDVGSVQTWKLVLQGGGKHSAKPDGALDLIERVSPSPCLELFARRVRMGGTIGATSRRRRRGAAAADRHSA